ncbi:hypothetical protein [Bradyrhizobium sp. CCBAU 51765]|uniref:hypothetical protein n=1 Tax=Bradyrhizobium sp. CCBAU 51765 TaxID=1325102 RepID=UPI001887982D|nr:hypothetical protein [Bradyrhizobium sp. CCBAU 51765]
MGRIIDIFQSVIREMPSSAIVRLAGDVSQQIVYEARISEADIHRGRPAQWRALTAE